VLLTYLRGSLFDRAKLTPGLKVLCPSPSEVGMCCHAVSTGTVKKERQKQPGMAHHAGRTASLIHPASTARGEMMPGTQGRPIESKTPD